MKFHLVYAFLGLAALAMPGCAQLTGRAPADPPAGAATEQRVAQASPAASGPAGTFAPPQDVAAAEARTEGSALPGEEIGGVFRGTGKLIGRPAARGPVLAVGGGEITLNFVNADIREVVRAILADTLASNYIIDPKVKGTITVQTSRPLPRGSLLAVLEEVLRLNGAALVRAEGVYEVVPIEAAPRAGGLPRVGRPSGGRAQGFGVQIVPLKYIAAAEMEKIIEPFVPSGAVLRVDPDRNLLVLGGTRQGLAAVLDVVDIFDVDWLAGMSFALFPLQSTDAETLVADLAKVFGDQAQGPLAGMVRFVPIERLNAILVISSRPAYLEKAQTWIERLDRGIEEGERRLYVYYVQNGRAADLAAVLGEIFAPGEAGLAPPRLAPGLAPVEIATPGAARGPEAVRPPRAAPGAQAGQAQPSPRMARRQARKQPAPQGAQASAASGAERELVVSGLGEIRIIADEVTNALVILATPRDYRMIEAALRKLDIVPLQVLVEATIAEVTLTDELKYGLQWFFKHGGSSFTLGEGTTPVTKAIGAVVQAFPGFSYLFASPDVRVVLNALDGITDVNVVSSPQLMILDNHTAILQVGDQVPIKTQEAVSVEGSLAPLVNTIELLDTGVILKVTPRVNAGGLVIMEIEQEVSDAIPSVGTSFIDSPTIQRRSIKTTVAVQSGETVALGGLIRDKKFKAKSGVPMLSKIPILGFFFGATTAKDDERTELLVLITPRVVKDQQEARDVTEELRRRLRAVIPLTGPAQPSGGGAAPSMGQVAPAPEPPAPEQALVAAPRSAPAAAGPSYRVQLAAYRSLDWAQRGLKIYREDHAAIFSGIGLMIERADYGAERGVYYLLQAGPLATFAAARGLCRKLNERNATADCVAIGAPEK